MQSVIVVNQNIVPVTPILNPIPVLQRAKWSPSPSVESSPLFSLCGDWTAVSDTRVGTFRQKSVPVRRIIDQNGQFRVLCSEKAVNLQNLQLRMASDGRIQMYDPNCPSHSFFLLHQLASGLLQWANEFDPLHIVMWRSAPKTMSDDAFIRRLPSLTHQPASLPPSPMLRSLPSAPTMKHAASLPASPMLESLPPSPMLEAPSLSLPQLAPLVVAADSSFKSKPSNSGSRSSPVLQDDVLTQSNRQWMDESAFCSLSNISNEDNVEELPPLPPVLDQSRSRDSPVICGRSAALPEPPALSNYLSPMSAKTSGRRPRSHSFGSDTSVTSSGSRDSKQTLVTRVEPEVDALIGHLYAKESEYRNNQNGRFGPPVLRGRDVLFIPAKKHAALENVVDLIKTLMSKYAVKAAAKVCQKKKKRQKKGFLVYLKLASESEVESFLKHYYPSFSHNMLGVKKAIFQNSDS